MRPWSLLVLHPHETTFYDLDDGITRPTRDGLKKNSTRDGIYTQGMSHAADFFSVSDWYWGPEPEGEAAARRVWAEMCVCVCVVCILSRVGKGYMKRGIAQDSPCEDMGVHIANGIGAPGSTWLRLCEAAALLLRRGFPRRRPPLSLLGAHPLPRTELRRRR